MFNSETLEVGIGMAFLFLLMSLICTGVKEWIEGIFKWRAMDLERGLRTLLDDPTGRLTAYLYAHPMVSSLYQGSYDPTKLTTNSLTNWVPGVSEALQMPWQLRRNLPSYIPSGHFAKALIDLVARGPADVDGEAVPHAPLTIAQLRERAASLQSSFLRRAMLSAIDHCDGSLSELTVNLQNWFDGSMDRASGWYKRRTQTVLFVLGLGAAALLNVDALYVLGRMTTDKVLRETVVAAASKVEPPSPAASPASGIAAAQKAREELVNVNMPMGWRVIGQDGKDQTTWSVTELTPVQLCRLDDTARCNGTNYSIVRMFFGWLMTAFAVMLGAPFWFDILNKFMVIRSTVKPREKSREEGGEDRADSSKDSGTANSATPGIASTPHVSTDATPQAGTPPGAAQPAETFVPHEWRKGPNFNVREIVL